MNSYFGITTPFCFDFFMHSTSSFHSQLISDQEDAEDILETTDDILEITDDNNIYYVEKILKYRYNDDSNSFEYFVQWLDCPLAFCSWEEECNILDKDIITEFWQSEQQKQNKFKEYELKLSKLVDGVSRIADSLLDDNVLERIQQIIAEMPVSINRVVEQDSILIPEIRR
eukprot:NODE_149_length_17312_cov_0.399349.p11 type:complete len:171 gc:universal NODE_149_length_17312_cov_0.399349:13065-12553(-)